jgi:hypothetical protein
MKEHSLEIINGAIFGLANRSASLDFLGFGICTGLHLDDTNIVRSTAESADGTVGFFGSLGLVGDISDFERM